MSATSYHSPAPLNTLLSEYPAVQLPRLIAHRGASAVAPENTLLAFATAKSLGATWVELDLMPSQDGVWVCFHDDTLERTSNGRGYVHDHDWATLQTLDAGAWFSPQFAGTRIPCWEQTFEALCSLGLGVNVELKPAANAALNSLPTLIIQLQAAAQHIPLVVSSFDISLLHKVREIAPALPLGLLYTVLSPQWQTDMQALQACSIHLDATQLATDTLSTLCASPLQIAIYTVNELSTAQQLLAQGAHAVFSDHANLLA